MAILLFFACDLESYNIDEFIRPHGPLFHRWLPDGVSDAISIQAADQRNKLEVWFDRRGYVDKQFIKFDSSRAEVDSAIMARQAKLEAGVLKGKATFAHATEPELKALQSNIVDDEDHVRLAKRIIDFLVPSLQSFILTLRSQYGQYWLREVPTWDARVESLGRYCVMLNLHWSLDGNSWNELQPTKQSVIIKMEPLPGRGFQEYLTKEDWDRLRGSFDPTKPPSLALITLARANKVADRGDLRLAFVEAVTALELAIPELLRRRASVAAVKTELVTNFEKLPLPSQLVVATALTGLGEPSKIAEALEAIEIRNDIVHEGKEVPANARHLLDALLSTVGVLLQLPEVKFPFLTTANMLEKESV